MSDRREAALRARARLAGRKPDAEKSSGGSNIYNVPKEMFWIPEKAGSYKIDIYSYEVTKAGHPDNKIMSPPLVPGEFHDRRPFGIHKCLGQSGKQWAICPKVTFGEKCPICEELPALWEQKNQHQKGDPEGERIYELICKIRPQLWVAFACTIGDAKDMKIFAYTESKFAEVLKKQTETLRDRTVVYYADPYEGRSLYVGFSEEKIKSTNKTYLKASSFEFDQRPEVPDEIINAIPKLDDIFNVMSYEQLKAAFEGMGDVVAEPEEQKSEEPVKPERARRKPSTTAETPKVEAPKVEKPKPEEPKEDPAVEDVKAEEVMDTINPDEPESGDDWGSDWN